MTGNSTFSAARRLGRGVGALALVAMLLTAFSVTPAQAQGRARRCAPGYGNSYPQSAPAYSYKRYPRTAPAYYDPYYNESTPWEHRRSRKGRTVAAAAVGAGGGAVLGGMAAGKKGAIIGAVIGGVAAGVIANKTGRSRDRYDDYYPPF